MTGQLAGALIASGRSPDVPESADIYGWLIGGWDLDVRHYVVDVTERRLKGEAQFARVLDGRAVQDASIMPGVGTCGTTLRVYEPSSEAWRVTWINPATDCRDELIGRRHATRRST